MELTSAKAETSRNPEEQPARVGRPKSQWRRKRTYIYQTEDQLKMLDGLVGRLEKVLGKQIARGTLISYMTVRLQDALNDIQDEIGELPDDLKSFTVLGETLDSFGK